MLIVILIYTLFIIFKFAVRDNILRGFFKSIIEMKQLLFLLLLPLLISCNQAEDFDWLLGNWQRKNEQEGRQTLENWQKKSDSEYIGLGFTLQNGDTIWQERIRLIKSDNGWNFEAIGKGETSPTIFKLTRIEKESFVSENEQNEFPKKIYYYKNKDDLNAIISGGGEEVLFEFKKVGEK